MQVSNGRKTHTLNSDAALALDANRSRATVLAFTLSALVPALAVSKYWRIGIDSAFYVHAARTIASGEGCRWGIPPVFPYCLAAIQVLANALKPGIAVLDMFIYINLFDAAVGFAGLLAAYFLIAEMASREKALLVLILLASSFSYFRLVAEPLTDVPYCAVSWAAFFLLLRCERRAGPLAWIAAGISLALAPLTRLVGIALVLAAIATYGLRTWRGREPANRRAAYLAILVSAALAAVVTALLVSLKTGGDVGWTYLIDVGWSSPGDLYARIFRNMWMIPHRLPALLMGRGNITAVGVPLVALTALGAAVSKRTIRVRLVGWYVAFYCVMLVFPNYNLSVRYLLPLLPFILLWLIEAVGWLGRLAGRQVPWAASGKALPLAGASLVVGVVCVNLCWTALALRPRFSEDFYASYRNGYYEHYIPLTAALTTNPPPGTVMARQVRLIEALSNVESVGPPYLQFQSYRPDIEEIATFIRGQNVRLIVVDPQNAESARILGEFVEKGPFNWRLRSTYGALEVYVRDPGEPHG